jgi:hypothetical protein
MKLFKYLLDYLVTMVKVTVILSLGYAALVAIAYLHVFVVLPIAIIVILIRAFWD